MTIEWLEMIALILAVGVAGCVALYAGYSWGRFAAVQALDSNASKWKAYALALVPPLVFALSFHFDSALSPIALRAFFGLGAPAAIGACLRYHSDNEPNGHQA